MPNRIIKESIHVSERLNALTDFQFRVWVSLLTYVDDYGRGDARPAVIKGTCFPLRERTTTRDIDAALHALAGAGCVCLYEIDGKPYLCFPRWGEHQRIQQKKSKYPAPPEVTVTHRESPPESESESEYKSESESNPKSAWTRLCEEDAELGKALRSFAEMRQKMRRPLTERAKDGILKELEKYPRQDWIALVDQSINKGWQSIYPLHGEKQIEQDPYASYDIRLAEEEMHRSVPKLKPKGDRV